MNVLQKSLRELLDFCGREYSDNQFLSFADGESSYTYSTFHSKVEEVATLLHRHGIRPGEKVGLLAQNMPNWVVSYFATVGYGMITVPMLPDFSESEVRHILKHSGSKALFISERLLSKLSEKARERLGLIIRCDDFEVIKSETADNQDKEQQGESAVELYPAQSIKSEDLAAIIYTSGTTGSSKGVMLTHKNLCANLWSAQQLRPSFASDIWLSILPLSHTLESSLSMMLPMLAGASIYYIDKAPTPTILMKALSKVRPTTMLSVPLIIEKIYKSAVLPKFRSNAILRFLYSIPVTRKVLNKKAGKMLMEKFGGRIRFFGIGGAKLDTNVERFLLEAHFPYAIGYGLTETSPLIAGAIPSKVRLGSTGPIVEGVTVKLLNKDPETGIGEICVKGDNVMSGYFDNPETTASVFTPDGWFRTHDLGMFDKDGWLYIKGRSSTTIIGPSGENIYPEEIESVINSHDMVSESIVTKRKGKLIALVHFDQEKLKKKLSQTSDEYQEKFENLKKEVLEYVNEKVSKFSRLSEIKEQLEEFEKTATKKIKRYKYNEDKDSDKKNTEGK